jgi:hypothetical protein
MGLLVFYFLATTKLFFKTMGVILSILWLDVLNAWLDLYATSS